MKKLFIYLFVTSIAFAQYSAEIKATMNSGEIILNGKKYSDISEEKMLTIDESKVNELEIKTVQPDGSFYYGKVVIPKGSINKNIFIKQDIIFTEFYFYKKARNLEGYNTYLEKYPNGEYSKTVNKLKENYYYSNTSSLDGINVYLQNYPNGVYKDEIIESKENYLYDNIKDIRTAEEYLAEFPKSQKSPVVFKRLEEYYFININDISTSEMFLKKYPNSLNVNKALELRELYVFKNVKDLNTILYYKKEYPNGKYINDVNKKMDNIYYENTKNLQGIEEYLLKFPQGLHIEEVRQLKSTYKFNEYLQRNMFADAEIEIENLEKLNMEKKRLKLLKNELDTKKSKLKKAQINALKPNGLYYGLGISMENNPYIEKYPKDGYTELPIGLHLNLAYKLSAIKFEIGGGGYSYSTGKSENLEKEIGIINLYTKVSLDLLGNFKMRPLYLGIGYAANKIEAETQEKTNIYKNTRNITFYSLELPITKHIIGGINYKPDMKNNEFTFILKFEFNNSYWRNL